MAQSQCAVWSMGTGACGAGEVWDCYASLLLMTTTRYPPSLFIASVLLDLKSRFGAITWHMTSIIEQDLCCCHSVKFHRSPTGRQVSPVGHQIKRTNKSYEVIRFMHESIFVRNRFSRNHVSGSATCFVRLPGRQRRFIFSNLVY